MIFSAISRSVFALALALSLLAPAAHAQTPAPQTHAKGDLTGDWQGTLQAQKALRTVGGEADEVVDQTGIPGKFDISVTFTPDDSQFHGHPPPMKKADDVEAAPSLFEAIQQKLGLKLEAQKAPVPVVVIDHVEKPSAN